MSDLTGAEIEAYARANTSVINLMALEIRHPLYPGPVRVVQGDLDIEIPLPDDMPVDPGQVVSFQAVSISVPEENLDEDPDSQLRLNVHGISGWVERYVSAAAKSFDVAEVSQLLLTYNIAERQLLTVRRHADLEMRSVNVSMTGMSITCGFTNTANREIKV